MHIDEIIYIFFMSAQLSPTPDFPTTIPATVFMVFEIGTCQFADYEILTPAIKKKYYTKIS